MRRRTFVRSIGAGAAFTTIAGCLTQDDDGNGNGNGNGDTGGNGDGNGNGNGDGNASDGNGNGDGNGDGNESDDNGDEQELSGTLRVATYSSMVDGNDPAGPWLKDAFEEAYPGVELQWTAPESGLNLYIQQAEQGAEVDADVFLGLNVDDLALVDDEYEEGGLFQELERDRLDHADRIRDGLDMGDPHGRALAYDTGYICLVYDEDEVDEPETLDDLTTDEYAGTLLAQNAQSSDPGQAFLLWTIDAYGEDEYLDYWRDLVDNDVRILDSWDDAYNNAYMNEERPMVVSYSTDQVYYHGEGVDESRHQIAFPNDQGYANPEAMGVFEGTENEDLAYAFMDFVLTNDAQAEIAQRNVQFPAVESEYVDLPEEFDQYAHEPPEAVTVGYDTLRGNLEGWIDDWAREVVGQ